jgi:enolase-phosphatase E1
MTDTPRALLLDVEGTTTSIAFVSDTLFPYAREHLRGFVADHAALVAPILEEVAAAEPGDPVATLLRWMDEDRKATPLKALQGMIWEAGYLDGTIQGHVYDDSKEALVRWSLAEIPVYIYSSGSVKAQELLFENSVAGDLAALIEGHFDTEIGPKKEAASYAAIAKAIGQRPGRMLFVSDAPAEVEAAREAGMRALLIDRDGGKGDIASLDEVA